MTAVRRVMRNPWSGFMSLKPTLETLDGLHEEVAKLYTKKDGKFVLDVEDSGLKSALQKEREAREAAEKALKAKEQAEEDQKRKTEEELALKRGEFDKIRAQDQAAIKAAEEKALALESKLRNGAMERAAMEAIVASGGIPEALMPHVTSLLEVVAEGDSFKVLVKGEPGKKLGDFVAGLKESKPWGFQPSGANGGGASNHQGGGGNAHAQYFDPKSPTYNYTKQLDLAKADPKAFEAMRSQFPDTKQE